MAPKVSTKFSNKKENNNTNEKEQNFVKMKVKFIDYKQERYSENRTVRKKSPLLILLITAAGQLITS
ncbi:hypothetical protein T4B_1215 [Trichinella pseudospiralis]|uniref:Uncharacterized protein n=2 Tax=Trichinella pseudospiralis TaxID=6337 RepID=A0A0V1JBJ5_TRIPS|nr:hypothetical protein T4A_7691 [Trichinella pseudospiralis]KRY84898.1 hypothetical protein T4D_15012 [Trichinella pseudospiralis]KRZ32337.1 hypothetical protein T4B_1215 [Trichinella pseudospiralis]